jgi:hypothetical protein
LKPCIFVAALLTSFLCTSVLAQSLQEPEWDSARISDRQLELNDEAVSSMVRGEPERAVALLTEALTYGEANILYLNLGRAYQKTGNCVEARKALRSVPTAPKVQDPPADIIDQKAETFLKELQSDCAVGGRTGAGSSRMLTEDEGAGPWPMVALGTGGALIVGGGAMLVAASAQGAPIRDADSSGRVIDFADDEAADRERRASTFGTLGISALAAGAVLGGVGTFLLLRSDSTERRADLGLAVGRDASIAYVRWEF